MVNSKNTKKGDLKFKKIFLFVFILSFIVGSSSGLVFGLLGGMMGTKYFPFLHLQNKKIEQLETRKLKTIEEESSTINVVEKVSPSVVSIIVSKDLSQYYNATGSLFPFDDFFDSFGFDLNFPEENNSKNPDSQEKVKREVAGGTGFIISEDGLILTNKHVVLDEDADYTVVLSSGEKYEAKVLGRDMVNDIAIVKIEAKDLEPVKLGDSDEIKIGQSVIAIGNALSEFRNTVTKGVVSGINRRVTASNGNFGQSETLEEAIQTDAAINPGNSGGPLLNLSGQVIGINTAVANNGQLVGFAIPINSAKKVIESVKKHGKIVRPFLGVRYVIVNENIANENKMDVDYGALIIRGSERTELAVIPGSVADKAGLVENDIILEVEGKKIDKNNSLAKVLGEFSPGDTVEMRVLSKGKEKMVSLELGEFEE